MIYFERFRKNVELYNPHQTLTELANTLETDKGTADKNNLSWATSFPDHYTWGYTQIYEKYMSAYRETKWPVQFMEIGIADNRFRFASVILWLSYFKNVNLYSVDNFWGNTPSHQEINQLRLSGTHVFYADQNSSVDWDEMESVLTSPLDFLVEDGSHHPVHMLYSLWRAIPLMKSSGYYFMEDIQHPTTEGMYGYNNITVYESIMEMQETGKFQSPLLPESMNEEIQNSYQLVEVHFGGPEHRKTGLAVFKRL